MRTWLARIGLAASLLTVVGCRQAGQVTAPGLWEQYRERLRERRFCDAYLMVDAVVEELIEDDEDIAGYEYQLLVEQTAAYGWRDWPCVLAEPQIPLERKEELVRRIHEYAQAGQFCDHLRADSSPSRELRPD
jgi:hypothetical protein